MGTCWFCLVSAEMISGQFGIGYYTWESYTLQNYGGIIVGMLSELNPPVPSRPLKAHTVSSVHSAPQRAGGVSLKTSPQPTKGAQPVGPEGPPE